MKTFVDGDNLVVVDDDFVDLQSSDALFIPLIGPEMDEIVAAWFHANEMVKHEGWSDGVKVTVYAEEPPDGHTIIRNTSRGRK